MKRILMLLFASVCTLCALAQTYDETDLVGKWNVTSMTGNVNNCIISFESLYFGDTQVGDDTVEDDCWLCAGYLGECKSNDLDLEEPGAIETWSRMPIFDFFISNNNKLHLNTFVGSNEIRLVIKEWKDGVMKLETYDGKTKIELKKDTSAVNSVVTETPDNTSIFDIKGSKVRTTEKGNVYIKGRNKFIAR